MSTFLKNSSAVVYQVGGAVRDRLLKREVKDIDWVVVGSHPDEMLANGFNRVGQDFPVFLHPTTKQEYALARTERKTHAGYQGFEFETHSEVTLEQDLHRRDLTINAMAQSESGEIIDPFNGQQDLIDKKLRHVSLAFKEDPVRILRVARFAARYAHLGFSVADETLLLMQQMVIDGEVDALVAERVFKEFNLALAEQDPQVFIQVLRDCHALKVILPEIDVLFGIPNPAQWHPEIDTGIHTLMVLQQACLLTKDPKTRFAALCHDLGKGKTPPEFWPGHRGHEKTGIKVIRKMCQRLATPKQWRELAEICSEFHIHSHRLLELKASTIVTTLQQIDAIRRPERFAQFLQVCEADFRGRTGWENKDYPQADLFQKFKMAMESIDTRAIIDKYDDGKVISQQIHAARVHAVQQLKLEL